MNEQNTSRVLVFRCLACDTPRTDQDEPCELCGAAADLHVVEGECLVAYTPHRLDALITRVAAETVAARLRERASWHRAQAAEHDAIPRGVRLVGRNPGAGQRADWHRGEAEALERAAACELAGIERGAVA